MRILKSVCVFALIAALCGAAAAQEKLSPNAQHLSALAPREANTMTGEYYADVIGASLSAQRVFREALPSMVDYSQSAYAKSSSMCLSGNNWIMWDTPYLSFEGQKTRDDYLGYNQTVSGFATGISRMFGETAAIGLALGYDKRKMTGRDNYPWINRTDTFHAAVYGGKQFDCLYVDAYAGYSRAWHRGARTADGAQLGHSNYNDTVLSAGLKLSYVFAFDNGLRIIPSLGLDYSNIRMSNFSEKKDAGGHIRVDGQKYNSLQMPIKVAVNKTFHTNFLTFKGAQAKWTPEVHIGYTPRFGAKRAQVKYSDVTTGAGWFTANSTRINGSYFTAGINLKIKLADKYIFMAAYDYVGGSKYHNHILSGTYGMSF